MKSSKRHALLLLPFYLASLVAGSVNASPAPDPGSHERDAATLERIGSLEASNGQLLPPRHVRPTDAREWHLSSGRGPGRRDSGNKIAHAADRGAALCGGANHKSPHRLNDVWEFHLAGNSWHLVSPPVSNYYQSNALHQRKKKAEKTLRGSNDVKTNRSFLESDPAELEPNSRTLNRAFTLASQAPGKFDLPTTKYAKFDAVIFSARRAMIEQSRPHAPVVWSTQIGIAAATVNKQLTHESRHGFPVTGNHAIRPRVRGV